MTSADRKAFAVQHVRAHGVNVADAEKAELRQLPGGWSRHSYLLAVPDVAGSRQELIIRVKPPGSLLDTDIACEYGVYAMLQGHDVPVPRVYGFEADADNPFEGPFFVMERLDGDAPNVWRRRDRRRLEENWATTRTLGTDLVTILARIHDIDDPAAPGAAGRCSYVERVVGWQETWERVRLRPDPVMDSVFAWLLEREPADAHTGLVHGDYRIGNALICEGRITGVVDWELCYWGDTRFDLGYVSLAYLAGKLFHPVTDLVSSVAEPEWFFSMYEELRRVTVDREVVRTYCAFGAVILITILSTGIRHYHEGRTSDVRMAWNRFAIPGLRQDVAALMDW